MNDEFLYSLRRDPPPRFARELKGRLQLQMQRRKARLSFVRSTLAAVLIGGIATAAALLLRDHREQAAAPASAVHIAAPRTPAHEAPTDGSARRAPQVATDGRVQPPAEAAVGDLPGYTILTSALAQPMAQAVAEHIGKRAPFVTPRVRVVDANAAFAALCTGTDVVLASRRILEAELVRCRQGGAEIAEWKLGYQAVVLTAGPTAESQTLSPREVYLALARRIPDPADPSRLIDNPNVTWHDVDPRFDWRTIDVLAPTDAAVRELFVRLVMEAGCETYPSIRELKQRNRRSYDDACHQLRSDGRYREVPLSNTLVTQQLWAEPNWLAVLGYSYYDVYRHQLLGTMLEGAEPTLSSLEDGTYPAARPVYAYAVRDRLRNPLGMALAFELSDQYGAGAFGYLVRYGLVLPAGTERRIRSEPSMPPALESLKP